MSVPKKKARRGQCLNVFTPQPELARYNPRLAILPVGSIEQHSLHLPLGTDAIIAWHMSGRIAEALAEAGVANYLLPTQPFATSLEHKGFKGTVTLRPPTLALVVKDIVGCLYEHGFKLVVVMNFHGGNFILKPTIREINYTVPGMKTIYFDAMDVVTAAEVNNIFTNVDLHAGEVETSIMLALDPELVGKKRVDFIPSLSRPALDMYSFKKITPSGVWGRPSQATAAKGQRFIDLFVLRAAEYIKTWVQLAEKDANY
ncbi:MAG: creatininase family protein [Planctomycetota bacterium]